MFSHKANERRIGLGQEKATTWLGNAQSYYAVLGYVYLKDQSYNKIPNKNMLQPLTQLAFQYTSCTLGGESKPLCKCWDSDML